MVLHWARDARDSENNEDGNCGESDAADRNSS
jgi:hypothetical protein